MPMSELHGVLFLCAVMQQATQQPPSKSTMRSAPCRSTFLQSATANICGCLSKDFHEANQTLRSRRHSTVT